MQLLYFAVVFWRSLADRRPRYVCIQLHCDVPTTGIDFNDAVPVSFSIPDEKKPLNVILDHIFFAEWR